eukprot:scaffold24425_cov66-Phaeocystis_antarctica.AAC.1
MQAQIEIQVEIHSELSSECTGLGNQSRVGSSASAPGCAAARRADSGRAESCRSTGAAARENMPGRREREACEPAQGLSEARG